MLSVTFLYRYAECHYAECRYAECRGAFKRVTDRLSQLSFVDYVSSRVCTIEHYGLVIYRIMDRFRSKLVPSLLLVFFNGVYKHNTLLWTP